MVDDRGAQRVHPYDPALAKKLTLDHYASLSHLLVAPRGDGLRQVDEALAERGKQRRIALRMPHFFAALAIVARSDLVLTAPTVLAALAGKDVVAVTPPLALPEHNVNLLWHERFNNDPAYQWLREPVAEVASESNKKVQR